MDCCKMHSNKQRNPYFVQYKQKFKHLQCFFWYQNSSITSGKWLTMHKSATTVPSPCSWCSPEASWITWLSTPLAIDSSAGPLSSFITGRIVDSISFGFWIIVFYSLVWPVCPFMVIIFTLFLKFRTHPKPPPCLFSQLLSTHAQYK